MQENFNKQIEFFKNSNSTDPIILSLTSQHLSWEISKTKYQFSHEFILGATANNLGTKFSILVFIPASNELSSFTFFHSNTEVMTECASIINSLCYPDYKLRNIAIIINPISGDKKGNSVLENIFLPALCYSPHKYHVLETSGADFIVDFSRFKDISEFTDIVCMGGDGTVQQILTAIYHANPDMIGKINIGVLPTGTRNALAVELNGKNINCAILHAIKGNTFRGDLMKVNLDSQEVLATTAICWGIISDITEEAQ